MSCDKNHYTCKNNNVKPEWCSSNITVNSTAGETVKSWDKSLKEFVECCDKLEECIVNLTEVRDRPASNTEYYQFKKELVGIKKKAIVEAYNRNIFEWIL